MDRALSVPIPICGFPPEVLAGLVLRVEHKRWGRTEADLRRLALSAPHARSRERFLALREIVRGGCATEVAERTGRHPQTVMGWVHGYNEGGPEAVLYRRTGGRPPFARRSKPPSERKSAPPGTRSPSRP